MVEMAGDRVRLIPSPSVREPEGMQQQQEFAVARETEHIEERAERMQELEVGLLFGDNTLPALACALIGIYVSHIYSSPCVSDVH